MTKILAWLLASTFLSVILATGGGVSAQEPQRRNILRVEWGNERHELTIKHLYGAIYDLNAFNSFVVRKNGEIWILDDPIPSIKIFNAGLFIKQIILPKETAHNARDFVVLPESIYILGRNSISVFDFQGKLILTKNDRGYTPSGDHDGLHYLKGRFMIGGGADSAHVFPVCVKARTLVIEPCTPVIKMIYTNYAVLDIDNGLFVAKDGILPVNVIGRLNDDGNIVSVLGRDPYVESRFRAYTQKYIRIIGNTAYSHIPDEKGVTFYKFTYAKQK